MEIVEINIRRKHLCGIRFDCEIDPQQWGAEQDPIGLLALDTELCDIKGLKVGTVLSDEELTELVEQSHIKRAKSRAMWYLSRQDMPKIKLYRKLREHFPDYAAETAVERAVELGFIDDLNYARRRLQLIVDTKKVSLKAAALQLIAEGVSREDVEIAVEEAEYNPTDAILQLIERKYRSKLEQQNGREKIIAALQRKGYSYGEIRTAFKVLEQDGNEF